jgi:hypothetical protein
VNIPTKFLVPHDDIINRPFNKPVPYYYNILPIKTDLVDRKPMLTILDFEDIEDTSLLYWEIIDYYKDVSCSITESLIMITQGYKSWNPIHLREHNELSENKFGNIKATHINKYHRVSNNAIFYLYSIKDKKVVDIDRNKFISAIFHQARIVGQLEIPYGTIFESDKLKEEDTIKNKLLDILYLIETDLHKLLYVDKKIWYKDIIKDLKLIFINDGSLSNRNITDEYLNKYSVDIIKKIITDANDILNYSQYDKLNTLDICSRLNIEISTLSGGYDRDGLVMRIHEKNKVNNQIQSMLSLNSIIHKYNTPFFDNEILDLEILIENGTKTKEDRKALLLSHREQRKNVVKNYLHYLTSNYFTTLEDAYIVLIDQMMYQYVNRASPFYQTIFSHSVKEDDMIILNLSHGVRSKSNDITETDYMYLSNLNIRNPDDDYIEHIKIDNFDKYNDAMKIQMKKNHLHYIHPFFNLQKELDKLIESTNKVYFSKSSKN